MNNFDIPESFQYDPPETYEEFVERESALLFARKLTGEQRLAWTQQAYQEWEGIEAKKVQYRNKLEREAKEHDSAVEKLKIQIEKEKGRIRLEEMRKREREARELKRKLERDAEQERRDPTPIIQSAITAQIPYAVRDQHIFIPGMTRHGKTTQILELVMRDIENGEGVAILDPKGGLIRAICGLMPEHRINDCIYLDLENPVPLDILSGVSNPEFLVGDLKQMVLKGDTTLKRAEPILTRLIYTLLKVPGTSFTDIEDIFTLPRRTKQILDALKTIDFARWEYWENNWPTPKEYEPLTSRMTDFTENDSLRTILSGGGLKISEAMNKKKIILADLGGIGEPREIYGSLLVSQFQQAVFKRTKLDHSEIIPYHLFVDEFENFQTLSFAKILSVAGGLGLRLTVGNQYIDQLTPEIRHAIFGNVGTYIIFHIEEQLPLFTNIVHPYDVNHLARLPKYQAVYRVAGTQPVFRWTQNSPPIDKHRAEAIIARLKAATSAEYSHNRSGDNAPSNSPQERHTEVNGNTNTEPQAGSAPTPPHLRKDKNP
jgi:hypothetical protein